jgi:transposase
MPHFEEKIYRVKRLTSNGKEIRWMLRAGEFIRPGYTTATKIRSWVNPKTKQEIKDNAEAELALNEAEKDFKEYGPPKDENKEKRENLVIFYQDYSASNKMKNNRHLAGSLNQFKLFLKEKKIQKNPVEKVTEEFCTDFRDWLLERFNGETPGNYFALFKQMMKAAVKKKLLRDRKGTEIQISPAADVQCLKNPSTCRRDALSDREYEMIERSICFDDEIKKAFIFGILTALFFVIKGINKRI